MRNFIITLLCSAALLQPAYAQQQGMSAEDYRQMQEAMKEAQKTLNSPEFQQQMQEAMKQLSPADQAKASASVNKALKDMNASGQGKGAPQIQPANMQGAINMSNCMMEGMGQAGMNRLTERGMKFSNEVDALWSLELVPGAAPDQHARYRTHRDASPSTRDALMDMLLD